LVLASIAVVLGLVIVLAAFRGMIDGRSSPALPGFVGLIIAGTAILTLGAGYFFVRVFVL
jgi:hypothetical protein